MPPPASPPKRMTRARAKAVEDNKASLKTVKVATPASKANASRITKRKLRTEDERGDRDVEGPELTAPAVVAAHVAPTRVEEEKDMKALPRRVMATKPVVKKSEIPGSTDQSVAPKRARGRPKKEVEVQSTEPDQSGSIASVGPNNRAREANIRREKFNRTGLSAPPLKKKVTFSLDEHDKENNNRPDHEPLNTTEDELVMKPNMKPKHTGVSARPVRRPRIALAAHKNLSDTKLGGKKDPELLSPVEEVHSADPKPPADDVDELNVQEPDTTAPLKEPGVIARERALPIPVKLSEISGESSHLLTARMQAPTAPSSNSQISPVNKSSPLKTPFGPKIAATPAKRPSAIIKNSVAKTHVHSIPELDEPRLGVSQPAAAQSSHTQAPNRLVLGPTPVLAPTTNSNFPRSLLSSPARRPPSSMRAFAPDSAMKHPGPKPEAKASLYGTPARKPPSLSKDFATTAAARVAAISSQTSPMKSPPRRPTTSQRVFAPEVGGDHGFSNISLKSSLLGTPARRPTSPLKSFVKASATKFPASIAKSSLLNSPPRRPPSPDRLFQSASGLKIASPNRSFHVTSLGSPIERTTTPRLGSSVAQPQRVQSPSPVKSETKSFAPNVTPQRISISPEKTITSALRASRSPEATGKVHTMTPDEQAEMFKEELRGAPSPFTPWAAGGRHESKKETSNELDPGFVEVVRGFNHPTSPLLEPDEAVSKSPLEQRSAPTNDPIRMTRSIFDVPRETRRATFDSDESEDELQIEETLMPVTPSGISNSRQINHRPVTPTPREHAASAGAMTALANRFSQWKGASPEKVQFGARDVDNLISTPVHEEPMTSYATRLSPIRSPLKAGSVPNTTDMTMEFMISPEKPSQFEEAMAIREDFDELTLDDPLDLVQHDFLGTSQISDASQEYGDENAAPMEAVLTSTTTGLRNNATCTPAKVFQSKPIVIHTTSKVPLKPAADYDESPLARPLRRSHSLSGPLSPQSALDLQAFRQVHQPHFQSRVPLSEKPILPEFSRDISNNLENLGANTATPSTPIPSHPQWSALGTPVRTPRPGLNAGFLAGCVAYVDVYTTEGADASGIFVELLTQMGARCVKQWPWSPHTSLSGGDADGDVPDTKVGITHVVFKDGGKRTMEKVRKANGLVSCVGVAWVLDCERENKWLDEAVYAIEPSFAPRGGHRRRKSMEPKKASYLSPTKEFLNLSSSPVVTPRDEQTFALPSPGLPSTPASAAPKDKLMAATTTPTPLLKITEPSTPLPASLDINDTSSSLSPTTPYFLHPASIVQQTCPPKQTQEPLFAAWSGNESARADGTSGGSRGDDVRRKLALMRRKSLQFAPRVGSPLRGGW